MTKEKEITIRSMSYDEFDEYQDYVEGLAEAGKKEGKVTRLASAWVMDKIYGIDVRNTTMNPGTILDIVTQTVSATFQVDKEEEKN